MDLDKDIEQIRAEYELLDHWLFFNAGAVSVPGNYWLQAEHDFLEFQRRGSIESFPVPGIAAHPFIIRTYYECLERTAKLIHAKSGEVTHMYRVVTAANLIIHNLVSPKKGENVVFTELTYPSITYVLMQLSRKTGVELRRVPHVDGEIRMSDLEERVDDNTRLVCICRTSKLHGFTYDVKEVCRIAHEHGALVLDDAMQALGAIEVDVHEDDVDFLIAGSYKWLCGPEGAGIFYCREDLIERFEGYWNYLNAQFPGPIPFAQPEHDNLESWDYPLVKDARRFDQNMCTGPTLFGWNATLKFFERLGMQNIERRVRRLGSYLIEMLQEIGLKVLTPLDPKKRHGLIAYTTGSHEKDMDAFQKLTCPPPHLKPAKLSYRGEARGLAGIRVCTHFYNIEEEIDELINRQKALL
jgi:selenocysteine lyase/cysteine desulfurase